mgnify:CR=1 FL=1
MYFLNKIKTTAMKEQEVISILEESLEKIFDRFSQVETGYTRKYEGTGLGLAITKKLVNAMGGTIEVSSEVGKGSVFSLTFSFPLSQNQSEESLDSDEKGIDYTGKEVLIAEDNPMNVLVLRKLLEQVGVQADVANNGKEVVEMVEAKHYDLILMDIHMPEMDGFEATREIRSKDLRVPIVALSANITKKSREDSKASGMQDYITKPFTRYVIFNMLSKYLS